jgi:hypothetical protein
VPHQRIKFNFRQHQKLAIFFSGPACFLNGETFVAMRYVSLHSGEAATV